MAAGKLRNPNRASSQGSFPAQLQGWLCFNPGTRGAGPLLTGLLPSVPVPSLLHFSNADANKLRPGNRAAWPASMVLDALLHRSLRSLQLASGAESTPAAPRSLSRGLWKHQLLVNPSARATQPCLLRCHGSLLKIDSIVISLSPFTRLSSRHPRAGSRFVGCAKYIRPVKDHSESCELVRTIHLHQLARLRLSMTFSIASLFWNRL